MVINNPLHRCIYCKGREILKVENEEVVSSSLDFDKGFFYCRNEKECKNNIEAESSMAHFFSDNGKIKKVSVVKHNETVFEVDITKA